MHASGQAVWLIVATPLVALIASPTIAMLTLTPSAVSTSAELPERQRDATSAASEADDDRIVGRVVGVVADEGLLGIATNDDVIVVQLTPDALDGINIGDVVAVPKSMEVAR